MGNGGAIIVCFSAISARADNFCPIIPDFAPSIPTFYPVIPAKAGIQKAARAIGYSPTSAAVPPC